MDVPTLGPLGRTVATTPTDIWNDSCAVDELEYAIAFGAVGATANPTIVHDVWKKDPGHWRERTRALATEHPAWTEVDLAWAVVEEMSLRGAKLLEPAFAEHGGRKGRLSMQTNPTFFRTPDRMLEHGLHFDSLAPNIIVKFPATAVGNLGHGGGDLPGRERQLHRQLLGRPGGRRRRGGRAGPPPARGRRARDRPDGPGHHDHGRATRRLAAGPDRTRRHRCRPGRLPWSGIAVFKRAPVDPRVPLVPRPKASDR